MQKRTITDTIATVVIIMIVISVGCVELTPTTKIRDIQEHPEKYVNKKVTLEGGAFSTAGTVSGFMLSDHTSRIWIEYSRREPSLRDEDLVRVTGTVKTKPHIIRGEIIYIKAESVKIIKKKGYEYG